MLSKLTENPDKVVPIRALIASGIISIIIVVLSLFLPIPIGLTLLFFLLGVFANMVSFYLIVKNADRMITNAQSDTKIKTLPNLMLRYVLYVGVLIAAWHFGGMIPSAFAFIGIQISQVVIKLDAFVG